MRGPRTVRVAVRHVLGDAGRPRARTATWAARDFRLVRPAAGRDRVELECPVCSAALLAEVRDHARTRRVRLTWGAVSLVALALFAVSLACAVHEGGRSLPAGQSPPLLLPVSVAAAVVTLIVTPAAWAIARNHVGVALVDAPGPRRGHRIVPVRG
ncbi:hypothetical protein ABZ642_20115 [Streptomyces sp. NPDC007157]|uniref:hypothetical protein n=1 Tax=Streptomyces sp. NPDC007157 TaxID=3154681 RepID=UPI0033F04502